MDNKNNKEGNTLEKPLPNRSKLLLIVLISFGTLIFFANNAFPPTFKIGNQLMIDCPTEIYRDLNYVCGQYDRDGSPTFAFKTDHKANFQFINLIMEPFIGTRNPNEEGFSLRIVTSAFAVVPENLPISKINQEEKWIYFNCKDNNAGCTPQTINRITDIKFEQYIFVVKILNLKEIQEKHVEDIRFSLVTFNGVFQKYIRFFKWALFIISIICCILYKGSLSSLPRGFSTTEQRVVGYLALSLILFTQPILKFYEHQFIEYTMIRVIGITIPHSLIVFIWFILIERLASSTNRGSKISYKYKYAALIISLIHFAYLTYVYGTLAYDQVNDMSLDFNQTGDPRLEHSSLYFTVFSVFTIIWSVFRLRKIIPKLNDLSWRDYSSLMFTFSFVMCSLFFTLTHSFQVLTERSNRIVLLYGITVLYGIILQVIYIPLSIEIEDAEMKLKYESPQSKKKYGDLDGSDFNSPADIKLRNADEMNNKTDDIEDKEI